MCTHTKEDFISLVVTVTVMAVFTQDVITSVLHQPSVYLSVSTVNKTRIAVLIEPTSRYYTFYSEN